MGCILDNILLAMLFFLRYWCSYIFLRYGIVGKQVVSFFPKKCVPKCLGRNIMLPTSYFQIVLTHICIYFAHTNIHKDIQANILERRCGKMLVLKIGKHIGMSVVLFFFTFSVGLRFLEIQRQEKKLITTNQNLFLRSWLLKQNKI